MTLPIDAREFHVYATEGDEPRRPYRKDFVVDYVRGYRLAPACTPLTAPSPSAPSAHCTRFQPARVRPPRRARSPSASLCACDLVADRRALHLVGLAHPVTEFAVQPS
jgi:hypothetical protein